MRIESIVLISGLAVSCTDDPGQSAPQSESSVPGHCFDFKDNDDDGQTDCGDADCQTTCPEANCRDNVDNNSDGMTDCDDANCSAKEPCSCDDGQDNDVDGSIDCHDSECTTHPHCDSPEAMTTISGAVFVQGCNNEFTVAARPRHEVAVPTFYMDLNIVTVAAYKLCVDAGACAEPKSYEETSFCTWGPHPDLSQPIRCVSWDEAEQFCSWREARLCSESEWEFVFGRAESQLGIDARVVSALGYGAEFVADCWLPNYGREHPDGTLELSVPTDGTAVQAAPCDERVAKTVGGFSDESHCQRGEIDPSAIYSDTFFRCCQSLLE